MAFLDLDELPSLVRPRGLISARRLAGRSFLRADHLFDRRRPLDEEVRDIILEQTGRQTTGPIRLLTQLRYCGFYFSPLNLYYVYDSDDQHVDCIVAEVSNTPWKERHCYVLWEGNRVAAGPNQGQTLQFEHAKEFHVSPFMPMDMQYRWRISQPATDLTVQLRNLRESMPVLDAVMTLQRRELSGSQLRRLTLAYPLMTARISAAIYYQALKLWRKKCPFYKHPRKQQRPALRVTHSDAALSSPLPTDRASNTLRTVSLKTAPTTVPKTEPMTPTDKVPQHSALNGRR